MNYALPASVTDSLRRARVLVTGSEGFLGQHFVRALHECGADVRGLDLRTGDDVSTSTQYWHPNEWTHIIHAAGIASPALYRADPLGALDAAVNGTRNMLRQATVCRARLLLLSSSEVYGDPEVVPTPETYMGRIDPLGERSCYDESKRLAETLCSVYAARGVPATIVRLFNAFGPGMSPTDRRFMPNLRESYRSGQPIKIYGAGTQTRTFCFVSDTVRGCLQALVGGKPGRAYNVGTDGPELTMEQVARLAGVPFEHIPNPDDWPAEGEPMRRCPDISRARAELGYQPLVPFEDGLREFLAS